MGKIVDEGALSSAFTKLNEWLTTRKASIDDSGLLTRSQLPQIAMPFDGFSDSDPVLYTGTGGRPYSLKIVFYNKTGRFYGVNGSSVYDSFNELEEYMEVTARNSVNILRANPLPGKLFIYKNDIYVAKESEDGTWSLQPLTAINDLLADYLTESDLTETLQDYVTNDELSTKNYVTAGALSNYVTNTALDNKGYITETTLNSKDYLKNTDITYMTPAEAETLVNNLFT